MLTVRFESTFSHIAPLAVDVDGVEDERIARAVALETLAKSRDGLLYRRLDDVDFSFANLSAATFHGCTFPAANFRGADLRNARFYECDFGGGDGAPASFDAGTDLTNALLLSCNCQGVSFAGATLEGVEFNGANLRGSDMREVHAEGAKFYRCRTGSSCWTGADMRWTFCQGLEGLPALINQFAGDETDRLTLVQFQDLYDRIGNPAVPTLEHAKAQAIAHAQRAVTTKESP